MIRADMIQAVRAHAQRHYGAGWDTLVECWGDEDISRAASGAQTAAEAIQACAARLGVPVQVDMPYLIRIDAEDGTHVSGCADVHEAVRRWAEQTDRPWTAYHAARLREDGEASTRDDWGRRITVTRNPAG